MSAAAAYIVTLVFTLRGRFDDRREHGATAVEYGLMVGLIAVVIIVAVAALGTRLTDLFTGVGSKMPVVAP